MLPTLSEFLRQCEGSDFPRSLYVRSPGFQSLYVRVGPQYLDGKRVEKVFVFANVVARKPGSGAFTRLSRQMHKKDFTVVVECVTTMRFAEGLLRAGYHRLPGEGAPYFYLHA